jgi:hypothetical protein
MDTHVIAATVKAGGSQIQRLALAKLPRTYLKNNIYKKP